MFSHAYTVFTAEDAAYAANHKVTMRRDITITVKSHTGQHDDIGWIHAIEKLMDEAMAQKGFSRSETTKGDALELHYWQFVYAQAAV